MHELTTAAGHYGAEMGKRHIWQWSKEHDFPATAYEYDGKSIVCIGGTKYAPCRSRPMLFPQDFPSTCLDSTHPCQHCCCSWIRALSTLAIQKIGVVVPAPEPELEGAFPFPIYLAWNLLFVFCFADSDTIADNSNKVNVVTTGCGELWTSAS